MQVILSDYMNNNYLKLKSLDNFSLPFDVKVLLNLDVKIKRRLEYQRTALNYYTSTAREITLGRLFLILNPWRQNFLFAQFALA